MQILSTIFGLIFLGLILAAIIIPQLEHRNADNAGSDDSDD